MKNRFFKKILCGIGILCASTAPTTGNTLEDRLIKKAEETVRDAALEQIAEHIPMNIKAKKTISLEPWEKEKSENIPCETYDPFDAHRPKKLRTSYGLTGFKASITSPEKNSFKIEYWLWSNGEKKTGKEQLEQQHELPSDEGYFCLAIPKDFRLTLFGTSEVTAKRTYQKTSRWYQDKKGYWTQRRIEHRLAYINFEDEKEFPSVPKPYPLQIIDSLVERIPYLGKVKSYFDVGIETYRKALTEAFKQEFSDHEVLFIPQYSDAKDFKLTIDPEEKRVGRTFTLRFKTDREFVGGNAVLILKGIEYHGRYPKERHTSVPTIYLSLPLMGNRNSISRPLTPLSEDGYSKDERLWLSGARELRESGTIDSVYRAIKREEAKRTGKIVSRGPPCWKPNFSHPSTTKVFEKYPEMVIYFTQSTPTPRFSYSPYGAFENIGLKKLTPKNLFTSERYYRPQGNTLNIFGVTDPKLYPDGLVFERCDKPKEY
jgi:hypothetical protein